MTQPIRGKVARLLNAREIVINKGTTDGVVVGMYFDVMDVNEADIVDPDTGESLGSIERSKISVKIIHVQEKLSVAATYRSERVNLGGSGVDLEAAIGLGPVARALMPPKWVTKYETFEIRGDSLTPFEEKNSLVKIGDPVVQIIKTSKVEQKDANGD